MLVVINELSYTDAVSTAQSKSWYDSFFSICLTMEKRFKSKIGLKFSTSPNEVNFHAEYTFMKWLSNQQKEERSSVLSMLTREKLVHNYPSFKAYNIEGKGLGYAFENDESLISFQTSTNWLINFIPTTQESLNDNNDIETEDLNLRNLYALENISFHEKYFLNKIKLQNQSIFSEIDNGTELWKRREDLFPCLKFCDSTKNFLEGMSGEIFKNVFKKFKEYNQYFLDWETGDFDISCLSGNPRPESSTRERDFASQLTLTCPDGKNRLFTMHCNIGIWGYRIHFFPNVDDRKCIIGYVGKKIIK